MPGLQRVSPNDAKAIAVHAQVPKDASVGIGVANAVLNALQVEGNEKRRIMGDLFNVAGAVDNFLGTVATIEGAKANNIIEKATDADFNSYTIALGEAHRQAYANWQKGSYGTLADAQDAYRQCMEEKVKEVDALFFPDKESGDVPTTGNYFRYASYIGLTPEHPIVQAQKIQQANYGFQQVLGDWTGQQQAINDAAFLSVQNANIAAENDSEDWWRKFANKHSDRFVSQDAKEAYIKDMINQSQAHRIGRQDKSYLNELPSFLEQTYQEELVNSGFKPTQAMVATEKRFEQNLKNILNDPLRKEFADRKQMTDKQINKEWCDLQAGMVIAGAQKAFSKFKDAHGLNRAQALYSAVSRGDDVLAGDQRFVSALHAKNEYKGTGSRYTTDKNGNRILEYEEVTANGRLVAFKGEGGFISEDADATKQMKAQFIVEASKLDMTKDADIDKATSMLEFSAQFEPEFQQQVQAAIVGRLAYAATASPEEKATNEHKKSKVWQFVCRKRQKMTNGYNDFKGDDALLASYLLENLEGVNVSLEETALENAYLRYYSYESDRLDVNRILNECRIKYMTRTIYTPEKDYQKDRQNIMKSIPNSAI